MVPLVLVVLALLVVLRVLGLGLISVGVVHHLLP